MRIVRALVSLDLRGERDAIAVDVQFLRLDDVEVIVDALPIPFNSGDSSMYTQCAC